MSKLPSEPAPVKSRRIRACCWVPQEAKSVEGWVEWWGVGGVGGVMVMNNVPLRHPGSLLTVINTQAVLSR